MPDSGVVRSMVDVIKIQRVTQTNQIPTAIFEIDLQNDQPIMEIRGTIGLMVHLDTHSGGSGQGLQRIMQSECRSRHENTSSLETVSKIDQ
jgi:acetyl/propionyl-CoA carboxylase alpha subunit